MTFQKLFVMFSDMSYDDHFTFALVGGDFEEYENYDCIPYEMRDKEVRCFSSWDKGTPGHWLVVLR